MSALRDNLHQRHPGPVQIHQRMQPRMRVLARILFQMGAVDANAFDAAVGQLDLDPAVAAQRQLVLGDLIALRQVRVMVVLTRKDRRLRDLAVERQPRAGSLPRPRPGCPPAARPAAPDRPGRCAYWAARPDSPRCSGRTSSSSSTVARGLPCPRRRCIPVSIAAPSR